MLGNYENITVTDTRTLTIAEGGVILANKATPFTITVLAAGHKTLGYHVINIGAGKVTITEDGVGDLIELIQNESTFLIDDGTAWHVTNSAFEAQKVMIADAGSIILATEVEGALQENRTAIDLNTDARHPQEHNLFSADHPDTLVDDVVAGDIIIGNATPKWARLPKGTALHTLCMDAGGNLPEWTAVTGTGNVVRATSPTLVTPVLGVATGTSLNLSGILTLVNTTTSTTGVIYKGTDRFIHDFKATGSEDSNTFVGTNAGNFTMAIDGQSYHTSRNTGIGKNVLNCITTGYQNCGLGYDSLNNTTTGYNNNAVGHGSLDKNTTGYQNCGFGHQVLRYNEEGNRNIGIGYRAGYGVSVSNYSNNIFIGWQAGDSVTTASGCIIIGHDQDMPAGDTDDHLNIGGLIYGNIGSSQVGINVADPSQALDLVGAFEIEETTSSTTGVIYKGTNRFVHNYTPAGSNGNNLFVGIGAGNFTMAIDGSAVHASSNIGIGNYTLDALTTGYFNTAIGYLALSSTTSGISNVALGIQAGFSNTTGAGNFALGTTALYFNQEGDNNVALGFSAGVGVGASNYSNNVFIGYKAGDSVTTGSNNIIIGYDEDMPTGATDDHLNIGGLIYGDLSNGYVGIGTPTPQRVLDIKKDSIGVITLLGMYNSDTTNGNGVVMSYRADTTGAGASSYVELGALVVAVTEHDHATRASAFKFYNTINGTLTNTLTLNENGNVILPTDSQKILFGTGKDMSLYYDGTDGYIKSDEVAPSDVRIVCGAGKTLELDTPVYQDINVGGMILLKPAASAPDIDTFVDKNGADTTIPTYAFAVGEYLSGGFELEHGYTEGTNLSFHVHWQGIAAPTGTDNVQWRLIYSVGRKDTVLEPAVTIDSPDTAFDTQYECKQTDFADIDGTGFKIGDQFTFSLYRVASTGDAYAGDALVQTNGIHCQLNALGSRTVSTK